MRNAHKSRKPEEPRQLRRRNLRFEDNIKVNLKEVGSAAAGWIHVAEICAAEMKYATVKYGTVYRMLKLRIQ
jgi:hypothetical protein